MRASEPAASRGRNAVGEAAVDLEEDKEPLILTRQRELEQLACVLANPDAEDLTRA